MGATARTATVADLPALESLYAGLLDEMISLKAVWRLTDGLPEPIDESLARHLADARDTIYVGEYHDVPVGLLVWREDDLLPQAGGRRVATIRLIYTDPEARRVGVGEAMMTRFFEDAAGRGLDMFDAIVPPGHRHAKNFFESNGFKARRIVMHRDDQD